jgi:hypothetical protein
MANNWKITQGPVEVPSDRDSHLFCMRYARGEVEREVFVHISGTAMAAATETLPTQVAAIVATRGQAAVEDSRARGQNPARIIVDSAGGMWEDPAD